MLGVAPVADEAALRQAYVALARRHHPDVTGGDAARMRAINEAWATLGDPARRARYDRSLRISAAQVPPAAATRPGEDLRDRWDTLDDFDDRPLHGPVRLPGWLSLVPVALFVGSVALFVVGLVLAAEPVIALAAVALALSCLFFLAAPFIALFASRRPSGPSNE